MGVSYKKLWRLLIDKDMKKNTSSSIWCKLVFNHKTVQRRNREYGSAHEDLSCTKLRYW